MKSTSTQIRRLAMKTYLGRYLSPDEWKCISNSLGTKIGERFPILPALQLLKQERYIDRKSRKPWLKQDGYEKASLIRSLLKDDACSPEKAEWYLTIRSLHDYITVHSSEQPKRAVFESFINAAFEAKKWQECVECFESLQKSSAAVSEKDKLFFKAAVAYGKLRKYDKMMELLPARWLHYGCAVQLALSPIKSGPELARFHANMLEELISGRCGEIRSATSALDDLFVSAMVLLEEETVGADHFIKALELLTFRTKLHSHLRMFYHCEEDLVKKNLEESGFEVKEVRTGVEDKMCPNESCNEQFLPQIHFTSEEVADFRDLFLKFMLDEARSKSKGDAVRLEEQLHSLHKVMPENQKIDVVIDGMNAAFRNVTKTLHLDLGQIVFTKIQQLVENLKLPKILVLLPDRKALLKHSRFRFNELKQAIDSNYSESVLIHTVHPSILDDKFIIYAALSGNSFVLTNDFYRDHVDELVKHYPTALNLGSFLLSRRIDSCGVVTARNIRDRNAVKVEAPSLSSFISQFAVTATHSEETNVHGFTVRMHEPIKIDNPFITQKDGSGWQPYLWACANRTFLFSLFDFQKINNWINVNLR